jgi:fumarate hydratase class II
MRRGTEFEDLRWLRDKPRTTVSDVATRANKPGS